jgi:UDPglucose 6-dehydrogenase
MMQKNIAVIGAGYVGLVSGACFAKLGNNVICVDVDEKKVDSINNSKAPIYELELEDILTSYKERINATTDYKSAIEDSDITFVCVGTPSLSDGGIDLSYVKQVVNGIGNYLKGINKWHIVVIKSTVLPGTTQNILLPILERNSEKKAGKDFGLSMNPEFLREGTAVYDFLNPDRIVIGSLDKKSKVDLRELYSDFNCPIIETSLSAAEMIKYASNCFLGTKISFINEIGNFCKGIGVDTYEVAEGVGLDRRIGRPFLNSGIGWGGSCFPKDINALISWAKKNGYSSRILDDVVKVNDTQPLILVDLLKKHIPNLKDKTVGLLGLAFKPNTDDIRESRAIPIIFKLVEEGAKVKVYDPKAIDNFKQQFPKLKIQYCSSADEVLDSDAILITTIWDEFKQVDFSNKIVIDGRRLEEAKSAKIYEGVCW